MAALRSRCGHYVFVLWFLLLKSSSSSPSPSFFYLFPRLLSAVVYWTSTMLPRTVWPGLNANLECRCTRMCCTRLAENTGRKRTPKIRHLGPIAQIVGLYFTERVLNVISGQKIKSAFITRSFRCFSWRIVAHFTPPGPASRPFTLCGCVSIKCKIKWFIIKRAVYKLIKRLSACTFVSRS